MRNNTKEYRWLEYCKVHRKKHYYHIDKCPSCGVYDTPMPVSENVWHSFDKCDGCRSYEDHLR